MPTRLPKPRATENANHHLCLHGRTWWLYCAVHPTMKTKDKLRTESIVLARQRRKEIFLRLQSIGMLPDLRVGAPPARRGILQRTTPMGLEYAEAIVVDVIATSREKFPALFHASRERTCCGSRSRRTDPGRAGSSSRSRS